ncbi:hypothetical protein V6Z12_A05G408700 [Gossypium hirsutum]
MIISMRRAMSCLSSAIRRFLGFGMRNDLKRKAWWQVLGACLLSWRVDELEI